MNRAVAIATASLLYVSAVLVVITASFACADSVVGDHDWDPAPSPGWSSSNGWSQVSVIDSGGNPGAFLGVTFTNISVDSEPSTWQKLIYTPATSLFAGGYSGEQLVCVDLFLADEVVIGEL